MAMTFAEPVPVAVDDGPIGYIQWGPAIAGALAAVALSLVLDTFGGAIGIAVSSTSPTWRDSSAALLVLTGLYLVLVAIAAFALGGYLAGRMRTPLTANPDIVEFRDGTHGLLVWSIALIATAFVGWAAAQSVSRLAAPSGGQAGSAQSTSGENLIAYDLDRLFRAEKRPQNVDLTYPRSEASRILLTSAGHNGVSSDDRAYLIRLTAANTGLSSQQAEQRVNTIISQARDNIRKARRSGVILAFMAGAAALLGAAVAWFAACAGGEHRDGRSVVVSWWSFTTRRTVP